MFLGCRGNETYLYVICYIISHKVVDFMYMFAVGVTTFYLSSRVCA